MGEAKPASDRDIRNFGAILFVASAVVALTLYRRGYSAHAQLVALGVGTFFALLGLLVPVVLRPIYRVWMAVGHLLGRVTTPVVLAVLFFGVMVPLRALLRLFRRDVLDLRFDRSARTYWVDRRRTRFDRDDFERLA